MDWFPQKDNTTGIYLVPVIVAPTTGGAALVPDDMVWEIRAAATATRQIFVTRFEAEMLYHQVAQAGVFQIVKLQRFTADDTDITGGTSIPPAPMATSMPASQLDDPRAVLVNGALAQGASVVWGAELAYMAIGIVAAAYNQTRYVYDFTHSSPYGLRLMPGEGLALRMYAVASNPQGMRLAGMCTVAEY